MSPSGLGSVRLLPHSDIPAAPHAQKHTGHSDTRQLTAQTSHPVQTAQHVAQPHAGSRLSHHSTYGTYTRGGTGERGHKLCTAVLFKTCGHARRLFFLLASLVVLLPSLRVRRAPCVRALVLCFWVRWRSWRWSGTVFLSRGRKPRETASITCV